MGDELDGIPVSWDKWSRKEERQVHKEKECKKVMVGIIRQTFKMLKNYAMGSQEGQEQSRMW